MTRVKKGVNALKNRKNILRKTKGYRHGRSTKEREAQEDETKRATLANSGMSKFHTPQKNLGHHIANLWVV